MLNLSRSAGRSLALLVGICALGCAAPVVERNNADGAQKRYLLGADYYHKGMIPAALEELRISLELDPRNHEALYLSGLITMRQAVESQDLATRAQCLPPAEARVQIEDVDKKMRQAGDLFRRAVEVKAQYLEAWNALAAVDLHFKRWDDAVTHADRALSNASYGTPWFALANQGVAYHEKKDELRAGKVLRQALQQNPKFCVGRWRLAEVYAAQGDQDRARKELQGVVEDKGCPIQEAHLLLGRVLIQMKDMTRAEEVFAECRRLAP